MNDCPLCALRAHARSLNEQNQAMRTRLKEIFDITRNEPDAAQAASLACEIAAEVLAFPREAHALAVKLAVEKENKP